MPKQAEAKRDSVINPQNYNFNQFLTRKNFDALKTLRIWLHVPSGTHWSTSSDTHQVVEIYKETSTKMYIPLYSFSFAVLVLQESRKLNLVVCLFVA